MTDKLYTFTRSSVREYDVTETITLTAEQLKALGADVEALDSNSFDRSLIEETFELFDDEGLELTEDVTWGDARDYDWDLEIK